MGSFIFSLSHFHTRRDNHSGPCRHPHDNMELQEENLQECGANCAAHWAHRSERDSSAQAACARVWDGQPARKHQALSYLRSLENLPSKGFTQGLVWTMFHSNELQRNDLSWSKHCFKAKFLLKLSIFFSLKMKTAGFSNQSDLMQWGQDTTTFNYFWTTTTTGISKQRQQGGCREAEVLVPVLSWREGRQAPCCSHQLSAPTSSETALLFQQANCPKAQPPVSLLQREMNNKANLETRNQAGAWGNLCRLPQQPHKSMSPETTTLRTLWQQSPFSTWMTASYPVFWQQDCKPK